MIALLAGRADTEVVLGGCEILVSGLENMYAFGTDFGTGSTRNTVRAAPDNVLCDLVTVSRRGMVYLSCDFRLWYTGVECFLRQYVFEFSHVCLNLMLWLSVYRTVSRMYPAPDRQRTWRGLFRPGDV